MKCYDMFGLGRGNWYLLCVIFIGKYWDLLGLWEAGRSNVLRVDRNIEECIWKDTGDVVDQEEKRREVNEGT